MSQSARRIEQYLNGGAYCLVKIEERGRGCSWARLQHMGGPTIDGHETLWLELLDGEDRDLAVRHYRHEQFGGPERPFGGEVA